MSGHAEVRGRDFINQQFTSNAGWKETKSCAHQLAIAVEQSYANYAQLHNAQPGRSIPARMPRGRSPTPPSHAPADQPKLSLQRQSMYALHGTKPRKLPLNDQTKIKLGRTCIARTISKSKRKGYRSKVFSRMAKFNLDFKGIAWVGDVAFCVEDHAFGIRLSPGDLTRRISYEWTTPSGQMQSNTVQATNWSSRTHSVPGTLDCVHVSVGVETVRTERKQCTVAEYNCLVQAAVDVSHPHRHMIYVKPAHYGKYFVATLDASNRMHCCKCGFYIGTERKTRAFNQHFGLEQRWQNLEWLVYSPEKHNCICHKCAESRATTKP